MTAVVNLILRENVNVLAKPAAVAELDRTRDFGKQRVVFSKTYVFARFVTCAALTHDDWIRR